MVTAVALIWSLVSTRLGLCARTLPLILLFQADLSAALDPYEGKPIAAIQFQPPKQPLADDVLRNLLPLKTGAPLRASDVRAAIERLYSTGEYSDIVVEGTLENGGVVVKFVTTANVFVGGVSVDGVPEPPSRGQLVVATKLQLGTGYAPRDSTQAQEDLGDLLRRNGFYSSRIVSSIVRKPDTQEVLLKFDITPGRRARFDGATITGHPDRPTEKIVASTGWKPFFGLLPWRGLTDSRLQSGLESIRGWYSKNNRLLAHVTLTRLDRNEQTDRVTPVIDIEAGPRVKVKVAGAKVSDGRVRSLLPIYQERAIDNDLLIEGQKKLVDYLRSQGYFEAKASFDTELQPGGDEAIEYDVQRGGRHKLVHLEITGNRYFNQETLRERMYLLPATWLRYRWGRYSPEYLEKDLNSIRDLYHSNGFRDVEVDSRQQDNFRDKPNTIAIFIQVKEGPQWFVDKLQLTGAAEADQKNLRAILHSIAGQPYSDYNVASDRDSVLGYYYDNGYPNARFEFTATPAPKPDRMDLNFEIDPGKREYVRNVIINGLERTHLKLVTERISLQPEQPLSQTEITESQRRLYDLGIFARVNTAIQNPDGDEPSKYVIYSLEEARPYSVTVGFGAELARIGGGTTSLDAPAGATGFSPDISIGLSRINVLGDGHTASLQTLVSTFEQRALLTYVIPGIENNPNLNLQFAGLFDISKNVRTFSARREEGSVQLGRKLSKANRVDVRYVFRKVNILGTPLVTPELIPLYSQPVRVGLVGATFIQDKRDDPTDAHRGVYNTLDISLATEALGSQTGFGRVLARNATYHRLNKNLTLARSTTFGTINRYAGLSDIPLAERFFSGGSSSQRAFPDNQAGPRDLETGFPIGGNALFLNSVEMRFPLIGDNIGGVLFNDMGNVYSSIGDISLRWHQRDLSDFNYGVQSFGFGIRYRTPVGPVRVDLSLSPNSPRFFGFSGTYNQLIYGGGEKVVQRIDVFQFHISLGQAF
jgi:outer membrane protein assembly complex protein YaeT